MTRFWKASAIALLALVTMAPAAFARGRGVVIVGGGYGFYGGPGWYPGWYGPGWYGSYGGPYYAYPNTGNVKIRTHVKGEPVYVDGGYAGVTGKVKKIALRPGTHNIEVRDTDGRSLYQERVYVAAGRTVDIYPGG